MERKMDAIKKYVYKIVNIKVIACALLMTFVLGLVAVFQSNEAFPFNFDLHSARFFLYIFFCAFVSMHLLDICILHEKSIAWKIVAILSVLVLVFIDFPLINRHLLGFLTSLLSTIPFMLASVLLFHWGIRGCVWSYHESTRQ
jgi:flagellar biosynthesis protein FliQ